MNTGTVFINWPGFFPDSKPFVAPIFSIHFFNPAPQRQLPEVVLYQRAGREISCCVLVLPKLHLDRDRSKEMQVTWPNGFWTNLAFAIP
jgi:hypothetical protein